VKLPDVLEYVVLDYSNSKFKTTLSSLGIIIGVIAIVVLLSVGEGLQAGVSGAFGELELDTIIVMPGGQMAHTQRQAVKAPAKLTDRDINIIESTAGVRSAAPRNQLYASIQYRDRGSAASVVSVSPTKEVTLANSIESGRFLMKSDVYSVVVGHDIAEIAFDAKLHPGMHLTLFEESGKKQEYTIVGILEEQGPGSLFGDPDNQLFVTHAGLRGLADYDSYSQILVKANSVENVEEITNNVDKALSRIHRNEAYTILTLKSFSEAITGVFTMIKYTLTGIGAISLLVGGIGITNVMMLTVKDRVREIGVMKAVGATRTDVRLTFLLESSLLGLVSGVIGIALGAGISLLIGQLGNFPIVVTWSTLLVGLAFGVLTTTIAGVYPADQASRLDPIEALGYE